MANKDEFACLVRQARLDELACKRRVELIRVGLSAVVPLECLQLLTPEDLALRMCGMPYINVDFLKVGTGKGGEGGEGRRGRGEGGEGGRGRRGSEGRRRGREGKGEWGGKRRRVEGGGEGKRGAGIKEEESI